MIKINNLIRKITYVIGILFVHAIVLTGCSQANDSDLITGKQTDLGITENNEDTGGSEGSAAAVIAAGGDAGVTADNTIQGNSDYVSGSAPDTGQIYVYVCGAVVSPGVYAFTLGERAEAALEKAGGFDEDANEIYVNLAEILYDGQRLYFPYADEDTEYMFAEETQNVSENFENSGTDGMFPVDINSADVSELCSIPGIGETKARAIIAYREDNGRFEYVQDITNVSGIGESTYDKIADYICVN